MSNYYLLFSSHSNQSEIPRTSKLCSALDHAHTWALNFSLCTSNLISTAESVILPFLPPFFLFATLINAHFAPHFLTLQTLKSKAVISTSLTRRGSSHLARREMAAGRRCPLERGRGCQVNLAALVHSFTRTQSCLEATASSESMNALLSLASYNPFNCCLILMKCGWY